MSRRALEFFAGGGMARAGLGSAWQCVFANDIDERKAAAYRDNWGGNHLRVQDICRLESAELPDADLAWASFPCQDLSQAGKQEGMTGRRSGAYWEFWRLIEGMGARAPRVLVLENVPGAATSRGGAALRTLLRSLDALGYRSGALMLNAADFLPQSRLRLFVVAVRAGVPIPARLIGDGHGHAPVLERVTQGLNAVRWKLPAPPPRALTLDAVLEDAPWDAPERTAALVGLMNERHRAVLEEGLQRGGVIGCVERRTRGGVLRAEIRTDGLAGCLRTPGGGSSLQILLVSEGGVPRSRTFTPREAARLMGLPDTYRLPEKRTDALKLAGDGLAVPVVDWLARGLLDPLTAQTTQSVRTAAFQPALPFGL